MVASFWRFFSPHFLEDLLIGVVGEREIIYTVGLGQGGGCGENISTVENICHICLLNEIDVNLTLID